MSLKFLALALTAVAYATPLESPNKGSNDDPCQPCQPKGATGTAPPSVGPDLSTLYVDVLGSVKDIRFQGRSIESRASGFCCRQSLNCVNVQSLNIPMCYDKFTTNFAFADGSFGSLTTGEYESNGNKANLLSGNYTAGSQQGNIYAAKPQDKPNTSTLSVPPQYTGTGVGSAVPPNQLGSVVVYTTTIPGTTFTGPTTVPQSVRVMTVSGVAVTTTIAPKTITAAMTVDPETTVVTATRPAAASSTGAGARVAVDQTRSVGMSMLSALMYALYAL